MRPSSFSLRLKLMAGAAALVALLFSPSALADNQGIAPSPPAKSLEAANKAVRHKLMAKATAKKWAETLQYLLPSQTVFAQELLQNAQALNDFRQKDNGFGVIQFELNNLDYPFYVTMIAYDNIVGLLRIEDRAKNYPLQKIFQELVSNGYLNLRKGKLGIYHKYHFYEYRNPVLLQRINDAVAMELGPVDEPVPQENWRQEYSLFLDPLAPLVFGTYCGYTFMRPHGRMVMDHLVEDRQIDLIRRILRSANPEARVYAAEAMQKLQANGMVLTLDDEAVIAAIKALPIAIGYCAGWVIGTTANAGKLLGRNSM